MLFNTTPAWVVYSEVVSTTKNFMRDVTVIEPTVPTTTPLFSFTTTTSLPLWLTHILLLYPQWLAELASHFYEWKGKPMPRS